jgi:hypothetical protein
MLWAGGRGDAFPPTTLPSDFPAFIVAWITFSNLVYLVGVVGLLSRVFTHSVGRIACW